MSALTAVWTVATDCVPENLRHEPGHREILGFSAYRNESKDIWRDFLKSVKKRGLKGVLIITSDAHEGIIHAIGAVFPTVLWQRCQFHFSRNIADKTPKKYQTGNYASIRLLPVMLLI